MYILHAFHCQPKIRKKAYQKIKDGPCRLKYLIED